MRYVFPEPTEYGFENRSGHSGKFFGAESKHSKHLIIECQNTLTVSLTEHQVEFTYYIISGEGYFLINEQRFAVQKGDLVVIPPGSTFTFGGQLKMLLTSTPPWFAEQEEIHS